MDISLGMPSDATVWDIQPCGILTTCSGEGLKKYGLNHQSAVEIVASDYGVGRAQVGVEFNGVHTHWNTGECRFLSNVFSAPYAW